MSTGYWLLADIGGTNLRLALMRHGDTDYARELLIHHDRVPTERGYRWVEIGSLDAAIDDLLAALDVPVAAVCGAVLAIAAAVVPGEDRAAFTNARGQSLSLSALKAKLGTTAVHLINDYHAQGMVLPLVRRMPERLSRIVEAPGNPDGALGVLGPGTGLGVAGVYPPNTLAGMPPQMTLVVPGEGGSTAMGAKVDSVREILPYLRQSLAGFRASRDDADQLATLRYEDILSGPGLQTLYGALCVRDGEPPQWPDAAAISTAASASEKRALATFALFFDTLAMACADVALQYLAVGGVYITGGITQRNLSLLDRARFVEIFANTTWNKGYILRQIPVDVVTSDSSGLSGAAVFAQQLAAAR